MLRTLRRRTRVTIPVLTLSISLLRPDIGSEVLTVALARSLNKIAILRMISTTTIALPVCRSRRPGAPKSPHLVAYLHRHRRTLARPSTTRAPKRLTLLTEMPNDHHLRRTCLPSAAHTPAARAAAQVSSHMGRRQALRALLSGQIATVSPAVVLVKRTTSLCCSR
jgi:hypothetical protein